MKKSDWAIHLFFFICITLLVVGFVFLFGEVKKIGNEKPLAEKTVANLDVASPTLTPIPEPSSSEAPAPTPKVIVVTPKPEKRYTYLNLNGNVTTTATDWTDITSTDVLIDLANEYGEDAYVDWDAGVSVGSVDSKVFVRLYDATHFIGVNGSELISNSTTTERVASGRLYLWKGQNTYRVQIKSLNGIAATFTGGRIKIVY